MASTIVQTATAGREVRVENYLYPRWQFDITYSWMSQETQWQDLQTMMGFFCARSGSFDSFLYDDVTDDSVVGQNIGTGDGQTTAFQLVRTMGSFTRPIFAVNGVAASYEPPAINVYLDGSVAAPSSYSIGGLPVISLTLESGGGNFTDGTYNLSFTGGLGSGAAGTYTCSGGSVSSINLTAGGHGFQYPPQIGFPSGGGYGAFAYATVGNGGTLLFNSPPPAGAVITADFGYFWRCRFLDDHYDFENFVANWWELKKLTLQECRS